MHVKYIPVCHFIKAAVFRIPESAGRIDDSRISLTHLPLLLKLLEIPFNVGEGMFLTHDTVTTNQRERKRKKKKEKAVLDQTTPNNVVLTYNHLYLHTPDKGFQCFLGR